MRAPTTHVKFAAITFTVATLVATGIAHGVEDNAQLSTSGIQYWKFEDVGPAYKLGNKYYLDVTYNHVKYLWDPSRNLAMLWSQTPTPNLQRIDNHLGMQPLRLDPNTTLTHHIEYMSDMSTSFTDYYQLNRDSGQIYKFYIITSQPKGYSTQSFCCDNKEDALKTLHQDFGSAVSIWATELSAGVLLLSVPVTTQTGKTSVFVVKISKLPEGSFVLEHKFFLVPGSVIFPVLKRAGEDLKARYDVVLRLINAACQIEPSNLGGVVSGRSFFEDQKG